MSRLPRLRAREVIAALQRAGFSVHHQTGSHVRLRHPGPPPLAVTIPAHTGDIPLGTLRRIIVQAGLTVDEFRALV